MTLKMTLKDELRLLIPVAKENGLEQAAARLESMCGPQCLAWEKRPEWIRFANRMSRATPRDQSRAIIGEMRRWCFENCTCDFSWYVVDYGSYATVAFESERDAVAFALAYALPRVQWKDKYKPVWASK